MSHILVVDDELTIRKTLVSLLKKEGYQATEASGGADALSFAKGIAFDLVIVDVMMPQVNGLMVTKSLRDLENYRNTPVICLSGVTKDEAASLNEHDLVDFNALKISDWLSKPIDPLILIDRVHSLLNIKQYQATEDHDYLPSNFISACVLDLSGNILSCNKSFSNNAGYAVNALKSQSHLLVRHPDVPKALYDDMWETIKQGKPWVGTIKNKRKNGTCYWSSLHIIPIIDDGCNVAYKSVEFNATVAEISEAEKRYQMVNAGQPYPKKFYNATHYKLSDLLVAGFSIMPLLVVLLLGLVPLGIGLMLFVLLLPSIGFFMHKLHKKQQMPKKMKSTIDDIMNGRVRDSVFDDSEWSSVIERLRMGEAFGLAKAYDAEYESSFNQAIMSMVTSNLLMLDEEFKVIGLSSSMQAFFIRYQNKLRTAIPDFDADKLIGRPLNIFQVFANKLRVSSDKNSTGCLEFELDGLMLRIRNKKMVDESGQVKTYIIEWQDRTEQTVVIKQIAQAIEAMKDGDFSIRVTAESYDEDLNFIKNDINSAMDRLAMTIEVLVAVVMAQSKGDMSNELTGIYRGQFASLQQIMNTSVKQLRDVLTQTKVATDIVTDTSGDLMAYSASLSSHSKAQSQAMRDTNQMMNSIAASVQTNTNHAKNVANLTHQVQQQTQSGADVMHQTIHAMQEIQASSHKINDIVSLIDSIAFQTNLLALNAAVEAARAGEHGRGFAVVAGEVRNLALKSANAAKDIKTLINDSVAQIDAGTKLADKSGEMLGAIAQAINDVAGMVQEIANASAEQSDQISTVHQTITGINHISSEYDSSVENISIAAEKLAEEAKLLQESTAFFRLGNPDAANEENNASGNMHTF